MTLKNILIKVHRYLAICISPIFLIILVSGLVLSFKPILAPEVGGHTESTQLPVLKKLIEIQKTDTEISGVEFSLDGQLVYLTDKAGNSSVVNMKTGETFGDVNMKATTYQWFKSLHKKLLLDLGDVVEWVTYICLIIMIFGFLLMQKPRLSKKILSIHNTGAWILMPFLLMLPITAIMMNLKIGAPKFDLVFADADSYSVTEVIDLLEKNPELGQLKSISSIRGKYQQVELSKNNITQSYKINVDREWIAIDQPIFIPKILHEGTWSNGSLSGWVNLIIAIMFIVLTLTGVYSWGRRVYKNKQRHEIHQAEVLVAYASQTGTGEKLAKLTANILSQHISTDTAPLSALNSEKISKFKRILLIVSTTGDGDLPQQAKSFVQKLPSLELGGIEFAVLALGDRHYKNFCQAGIKINEMLLVQNASPLLDIYLVDGDVTLPWQNWMDCLAKKLGIILNSIESSEIDKETQLQLVARKLISNTAGDAKEVWQLDLISTAKEPFRPGDLVVMIPPNSNKPRHYSVGSSSLVGEILRLTVGLEANPTTENGFGIASYFLCKQLNIGENFTARIHKHTEFHPVSDPNKKIILIATGTGIASYPGFIMERQRQNSKLSTWLIFGNRSPLLDFYYKEEWETALNNEILYRVDTAFSEVDGKYIQHIMLDQAELIYDWIVNNQAHVYICGRQNTAGDGAMLALQKIYQKVKNTDSETAQKWLEDCLSKGQIHLDIFG